METGSQISLQQSAILTFDLHIFVSVRFTFRLELLVNNLVYFSLADMYAELNLFSLELTNFIKTCGMEYHTPFQ
jgi:hypothetical protein